MLGNAGQDQAALQEAKCAADALAWADAERDINVFIASRGAFGGEAFGIEEIWLIPKGRVAVQGVDANGYHRAGRDMKTTDLVVANGAPPDDPGRGEEPQAFVQHLPQIRQASQVSVCGRTSAKLLPDFAAQPFGCPQVLREQVMMSR